MANSGHWKSASEVENILAETSDLTRLENFYALSVFWRNVVFPDGYEVNHEWAKLLTPTPYGEEVVRCLETLNKVSSPETVALALYSRFFHHGIIYDWQKSDDTSIRRILHEELLEARIRLPHRFGRLLYDRFNDLYAGSRTDHLLAADVALLIHATPQGVYQVGKFVSGPLGIIDSAECRYIPPSRSLPLWHCSDTGCSALHYVELLPFQTPLKQTKQKVSEILDTHFGPPSEWASGFRLRFQSADNRYERRAFIDLPVILADALIGSERTTLVSLALSGKTGTALRSTLSLPPRGKKAGIGSPEEIAKRLSLEEQLQLLLVLGDQELVHLIDDIVEAKHIRIPLGQIRRARQRPPKLPSSSETDLSAWGLRSTQDDPVAKLVSLVSKGYAQTNQTNDLEWRLHATPGSTLSQSLLAYIRQHGPASTVRELVLTSQAITKFVCDDVCLSLESMSRHEGFPAERMLWKLGFEPPQYDDFSARFESRLERFNETVLARSPIATEDDRESVRAAGVNFFVSVEQLLDLLLAYNIWSLSSDHFVETEFVFDIQDARKSVQKILGAGIKTDEGEFQWNINGENSLGVLLRYVNESVTWMKSLAGKDRSVLTRSKADLPHFADDPHLPFPFYHLELWADSDPKELRVLVDGYCSIINLVQQANPAGVRNGLDHKREPDRFPTADAILACISRLREARNKSDLLRYLPKIYWLQDYGMTRSGVMEYSLEDSKGKPLVLSGPALMSSLRRVGFERPCLVAPGNVLGCPNAQLIFGIRETGEYENYWREYPRRRRIDVQDGQVKQSDEQKPDSSAPPVSTASSPE